MHSRQTPLSSMAVLKHAWKEGEATPARRMDRASHRPATDLDIMGCGRQAEAAGEPLDLHKDRNKRARGGGG